MPLRMLGGQRGSQGSGYDVFAVWREHGENVTGHGIDSGHFLPEEAPEETYRALLAPASPDRAAARSTGGAERIRPPRRSAVPEILSAGSERTNAKSRSPPSRGSARCRAVPYARCAQDGRAPIGGRPAPRGRARLRRSARRRARASFRLGRGPTHASNVLSGPADGLELSP